MIAVVSPTRPSTKSNMLDQQFVKDIPNSKKVGQSILHDPIRTALEVSRSAPDLIANQPACSIRPGELKRCAAFAELECSEPDQRIRKNKQPFQHDQSVVF